MSLKQAALAAGIDDQAARAKMDLEQRMKHAAAMKQVIDRYHPATLISAEWYQQPLKRGNGWSSEVYTNRTLLCRFQVDDVVIATTGYTGTSHVIGVEVPCQRCRQPAIAGRSLPNGNAASKAPEQNRADFVVWVGKMLTEGGVCDRCKADVGHRCPTCQRDWDPIC